MMFNKILIVCIGNICRSPMAEGLLKSWLHVNGHEINVSSAGIHAMVGRPAERYAQELMLELGIDISQHRARQLTAELLLESDLILVMDDYQVRNITTQLPSVCGKVHRLGKWSQFDIPDPYKKHQVAFKQALHLIEQGLRDWTTKLCI